MISRLLTLVGLVVLLPLAACGSTPTPAAVAPTPTHTPSTNGNGCLTQLIPVDPQAAATVVVGQVSGGNPTAVTVNTGQSFEIHLSPAFRWQLRSTDPTQLLSATTPEGWFNSTLNVCVWRFSATKAGSATLSFSGGAYCVAGQPCSQVAVVANYTVTSN